MQFTCIFSRIKITFRGHYVLRYIFHGWLNCQAGAERGPRRRRRSGGHPLPPGLRSPGGALHEEIWTGLLHRSIGQTLQGSFSVVSKPNFASKYGFESSRRDLHNALLCTTLQSQYFVKSVLKNATK